MILSRLTLLQPFVENGDPTRSQMALQQSKQSTILTHGEYPMVMSGFEPFLKEANYATKLAKDNGKVLYKDKHMMVIQYDNGKIDTILPNIYTRFTNKTKFKKNDILMDSMVMRNGIISNGKNLLTAITPFYGWNYQDSVVISESCAEKLTSRHEVDLEIFLEENEVLEPVNGLYLPKINSVLKRGDVIYRKRRISYSNKKEIFKEPLEVYSDGTYKVHSMEIYPQNLNTTNRKYELVMKKILTQLENYRTKVFNDLSEKGLSKREIEEILYISKKPKQKSFKLSSNKELTGTYIKIKLVHDEPAIVGDKLANRHGNKGVISIVVPDEKMMKVNVNGEEKTMDLLLNPMGIISRMNVSQIFELSTGLSLDIMKTQLRNMEEDKRKDYILKAVNTLDNTKNHWYSKQTEQQIKNKKIDDKFIDEFYFLAPPFENDIHNVYNLMNMVGTKSEYPVYDPISQTTKDLAVGYLYTYKLVHMVEHKYSARSIGKYMRKTMQPVKGRTQKGGQRFGEMEVWALLGYDASENLKEFLTLKSDHPDSKHEYISSVLHNLPYELELEEKTETNKLLMSYFRLLGLDMGDGKNI
jgi:DNA-directed RNA polymerase subunit beta